MVSSHPVRIILIIIRQTLLLCVILWLLINTRWFSYIIFLIFLGGIIILFIYISRLASNEKFFVKIRFTTFQAILIIRSIYLFIRLWNPQNIKVNKIEPSIIIFKIYSDILINLTLFSIFYLIFTLIVVVKITSILRGPLRSKY